MKQSRSRVRPLSEQGKIFLLSAISATLLSAAYMWLLIREGQSLSTTIVLGLITFVGSLQVQVLFERLYRGRSLSWKIRIPQGPLNGLSAAAVGISALLALGLWYYLPFWYANAFGIFRTVVLLVSFLFFYFTLRFALSEIFSKVSKVQEPHDRVFVGRDEELAFLASCAQDLYGVKWVHLYGIAGIGKTALVTEFCERSINKSRRSVVYRFDLTPEDKRSWSSILSEELKIEYHEREPRRTICEFAGSLSSALVVIDDLPTKYEQFEDDFAYFLVQLRDKDVLVITTSRERPSSLERRLPSDIYIRYRSLAIRPLSSIEVQEYIRRFLQRKQIIDPDTFQTNYQIYFDMLYSSVDIWSATDGDPYALALLLDSPQEWSNIKGQPKRLAESRYRLLDLVWTSLNNNGGKIKEALYTLSVVATYAREWGEDIWASLVNAEWMKIQKSLLDRGLVYASVGESTQRYWMHDLLRRYVYEQDAWDRTRFHKRVGEYYEARDQEDTHVLAFKHLLDAQDIPGVKRVYERALDRLVLVGSFREMVDLCEQTLSLLNSDGEDRANAMIFLARARRVMGDYSLALEAIEQAITTLQNTHQTVILVRALRGQADIYRLMARHENAIRAYEESRQLALTLSDHKGVAKAAYGVARIYRLRGDLKIAATRYEEAREAFHRLGLSEGEAWALFGLAEVHRMEWSLQAAQEEYSLALRRFREAQSKEGEAYAVWGTGEIKRLLRDYKGATGDYLCSEQICLVIGDRRSRAWALLGLAEVERMQGNYARASEYYEHALDNVRSHEAVETAHAMLGMAATKRLQGLALREDYGQSIDIYQSLEMQYSLVHALVDRAMSCVADWDLARRDLEQALKICMDQVYSTELDMIQELMVSRSQTDLHPLVFP